MSAALTALQRQSEEEVRIQERLSQLQAEESVLVANREQRLAQYGERREQDHADALKREQEISQALKVLLCPLFSLSSVSRQHCPCSKLSTMLCPAPRSAEGYLPVMVLA